MTWLAEAAEQIRRDPATIETLFPIAGRQTGRENADAARAVLLQTLPSQGLTEQVRTVYQSGDNDEKRAVLRALPALNVGDSCVDLLRDALRSNDSRLVMAALGPYAQHLPDAEWRQAVLKSIFMAQPLAGVHGLMQRADSELGRMLGGLRDEREAAGRSIPADAAALLTVLAEDQELS